MVIFDTWIFFLRIVSGKGASIFNGRGGVIFQWGKASVLGGGQLMRWTYALVTRRFKVFHGVGGMFPFQRGKPSHYT